jgi:hypothetical protein
LNTPTTPVHLFTFQILSRLRERRRRRAASDQVLLC